MDNPKKLDSFNELLLFPYSHHDHAYMSTRNWHKRRYVKTFCEVLDILNEDPSYTWHIDNIEHSWLPFVNYCPERVDEFIQRVKEGRICIVNGGFSLLRTCKGYEETYIRNMVAGKKLFQKTFGIEDIPVFYNADTGCGHSQLPQLFRLCGHKYYHFMRPFEYLNTKKVPIQFQWEGLDGSRVWVARTLYMGFSNQTEWMQLDPDTQWDEKKRQFAKNELPDAYNTCASSDVLFAMVGWDDTRPRHRFWDDQPMELEPFIGEWNAREHSRMRYATMNEGFALLEQRELPVWKGAIDHGDIGFHTPLKGSRSQNRALHTLDALLVELEKLCVMAEPLGFPYPEDEIAALWENQLLIAGHAMDVLSERDCQEIYWLADSAIAKASTLRLRVRDHIVNAVKNTNEAGQQVVAINTLNWETQQPVRFQVTEYNGLCGFDLVDADGNHLPYQVTDYFEDFRHFTQEEMRGVEIEAIVRVPAMGYTVLSVVPNQKKLWDKIRSTYIEHLNLEQLAPATEQVTFDNGQIRVSFHQGTVTELRDVTTGKGISDVSNLVRLELCQFRSASGGILQPKNPVNVWKFIPKWGKVLENGPVSYVYKTFGHINNNEVAILYTLKTGAKGLDIRVETNFTEAMEGPFWFCIHTDPDSDIHADIPYGAEKKEYFDHLRQSTITEEGYYLDPEWDFPGQTYGRTWCSFISGGAPMALVSKTNHWRYNYDRKNHELKLLLSNILDLQAKDRFWQQCPKEALGLMGKHTFELSILFHEAQGHYTDIQKYSRQLTSPLFADQQMTFAGSGHGEKTYSLLHTDSENVLCTALYKQDGKYFARFFECEGTDTEVVITLPESVIAVRPVDLEGNTLSHQPLAFNRESPSVKVPLKAWQILTLEWQQES